jgi:hypothetical protein
VLKAVRGDWPTNFVRKRASIVALVLSMAPPRTPLCGLLRPGESTRRSNFPSLCRRVAGRLFFDRQTGVE